MIKLYFKLVAIILLYGCTEVEESKNKSLKNEWVTINKKHYSYLFKDSSVVDTNFTFNNEVIDLLIKSYSLNDSALSLVSLDTNKKVITETTYFNHDWLIDFRINEQAFFKINRSHFKNAIHHDLLHSVGMPYINLIYVDTIKHLLVLRATFCYPETDDCDDAYALVNWMTGKILFSKRHGGMWCASNIHVFENLKILSCNSLSDFNGKDIINFNKNQVVLTEPVNDSSFVVVYDLINVQEIRIDDEGNKRFYEERDSVSNNAFVYSIDGNLKYSFRFDGFYMPLGYDAYKLRTYYTDQLYLFDFKKGIYFSFQNNFVKIRKLTTYNQSDNLFKKDNIYTVSTLTQDEKIFISDSLVYLVD